METKKEQKIADFFAYYAQWISGCSYEVKPLIKITRFPPKGLVNLPKVYNRTCWNVARCDKGRCFFCKIRRMGYCNLSAIESK